MKSMIKFRINLNAIILLIIFAILLLEFFLTDHFPEGDEVSSITQYTDIRSVFSKNYPNNHVLNSFLSFIINNLFGVNIVFLRFISILSLLAIIVLFFYLSKSYNLTFLLILAYLTNNLLITYSALYRGYYLQAFFFTITFILFKTINKNCILKIKIIYLLSCALLIHLVTSAYLILPILLVATYKLFYSNEFNLFYKIKCILLYFFIPLSITQLITYFITGLYNLRITNFSEVLSLFYNLDSYILSVLYQGFLLIYFNQWTNVRLSDNYTELFLMIGQNPIFFSIFVLSLIKALMSLFSKSKFFKKSQELDLVVILFFVFFILIDRLPFERVFIGFYFFFAFYLLLGFDLPRLNKLWTIFLTYVLVFLISINLVKLDFSNNLGTNFYKREAALEKLFYDCKLNSVKLIETDRHVAYYIYLKNCKKKPDILEFYKFYTLSN
jgi:hypothetical protein